MTFKCFLLICMRFRITQVSTILIGNALIASIRISFFSFCVWFVFCFHLIILRMADCQLPSKCFKSNKIVPRLTQLSIDSLLQFTMQCNALCSQFSFMNFYMFLVPLELSASRKRKNSALQQRRGIWRGFQPRGIPNGIQNLGLNDFIFHQQNELQNATHSFGFGLMIN